jgi:hypothetical protein
MTMMKRLLLLAASFALAFSSAHAGPFADRKAQAITDSGKPVAVKGGVLFAVPSAYDATFDAVVRALKKDDESIALADRETGVIATEIEITGGWKQTGTRTVVSLIKESATETTVKVVVTVQKRYKALQTEPWSDPELEKTKTPDAAVKLKAALAAK